MKREAPAALRNREPILKVLRRRLAPVLTEGGTVVEIASGSGTHASYFVRMLPGLTWQPTDVAPEALASIEAHRLEQNDSRFLPALRLDVTVDTDWASVGGPVAAIFCANMIHIAPWATAVGLFRGAGRTLGSGGQLLLYGPFRFGGSFTADSNAAFDASLRSRDPAWGVRDVDDLQALAAEAGLSLDEKVEVPANNHLLIWVKR